MEEDIIQAPIAAVRRIDQSRAIGASIAKIRRQLEVNLTYFSKDERETLNILQSHIERHLIDIEENVTKFGNARQGDRTA